MPRLRKIDDTRDWTGYWIRQVLAERRYEERTKFSINEIRNDTGIMASLAEAYSRYWGWEKDMDIDAEFPKQYRNVDLMQLGIDYIVALGENLVDDDPQKVIDLDTRVHAVQVYFDPEKYPDEPRPET